jgi:hypothetical protein
MQAQIRAPHSAVLVTMDRQTRMAIYSRYWPYGKIHESKDLSQRSCLLSLRTMVPQIEVRSMLLQNRAIERHFLPERVMFSR